MSDSMRTLKPETPVVQPYGSGGESLLEQYCKGCDAVEEALKALPVPHERDYYVARPTYARARAEHEARVAALRGILAELKGIAQGVSDQLDKRAEARATRSLGVRF